MKKAKGIVWNLKGLYSVDELEKIPSDVEKAINSAKTFKGKYYSKVSAQDCSSDIILQALSEYEDIIEQAYRPYAMASLLFSGDGRSDKYKALVAQVQDALTRINNETLFLTLEIQKISEEKIQEIYASGTLGHYQHYLESLRLFTPYMLQESEEKIINSKNLSGKTAFVNLFDEFTASFEWQFELNGETRTMTESEIRELFRNPAPDIRKRAKVAHDGKYGENALIFTNVFGSLIKDHATEMEMRGYATPIEPTHLANKVPPNVVETMIEVTTQNFKWAQQYYRLKAKMLGVPKVHGSDLYAPVSQSDRVIPFDEGKTLVVESFGAFSPEFGEIIQRAFSENWIDAEIRPGKRGGAFCLSVSPALHPFVLMNYVDNLYSVYTMAHELGHALHSVLSSEKQSMLTFHPPLVLAETASVFAEMLLSRKLLSEELDRQTRIQILASKLEDFFATISRQTMYIKFELNAHLEGAKRRLSADNICELWVKHREEMYGDSVEFWPEEKWYWAVVPHFIHTRFYCYAYTFGALFVLALYNRYLEEGDAFVPRYRELLAAGDSVMPQKLLQRLNMDFSRPDFWQGGFKVIQDMLMELTQLMES
ncbi:M3 family oligoendopeptidase [bacterium]|nr:M3 family oligoendopeptidase [bacterium]